jgi:hypothetical protein
MNNSIYLKFPLASEWWSDSTYIGVETQLFMMGIGIVILTIILVNMFRNKFGKKHKDGTHLSANGHHGLSNFSGLTLHRITGDLELNHEQTRMLEYVIRSGGITDPERMLHSPELLDRHFKRTYRLIERTVTDKEELDTRISVLFDTRNIIESKTGDTITASVHQIPANASATLIVGAANYPVQVISLRGDTLVVENPRRVAGNPLYLPKGSKANLAFASISKGFSLEARVLGIEATPEGQVLRLAHSGQLKKHSSRRFRRRQIAITTSFYFVSVDSKTKKMIVEKKRLTGNIMDISIGGCSIKTRIPVNPGQRLKIEFTQEDDSVIAALGEVLRTNRSGANTTIHVKFLKVPRKSLNTINAMVYEYAE